MAASGYLALNRKAWLATTPIAAPKTKPVDSLLHANYRLAINSVNLTIFNMK